MDTAGGLSGKAADLWLSGRWATYFKSFCRCIAEVLLYCLWSFSATGKDTNENQKILVPQQISSVSESCLTDTRKRILLMVSCTSLFYYSYCYLLLVGLNLSLLPVGREEGFIPVSCQLIAGLTHRINHSHSHYHDTNVSAVTVEVCTYIRVGAADKAASALSNTRWRSHQRSQHYSASFWSGLLRAKMPRHAGMHAHMCLLCKWQRYSTYI